MLSEKTKAGRKKPHPSLTSQKYDSNKAVDWMLKRLNCKNDCELARKLGVDRQRISLTRHRKCAVGDKIIIKLHELTGMPTLYIKSHLGMQ